MSKFAAIGTDGRRPVVWGLGDTEAAALADGQDELRETGGYDPRDPALRMVPVSDERAATILAGDVSADDL